MKFFIALATLVSCSFANAEYSLGVQGIHDVVVPTLWGNPAGADLVQGMMYYDASAGTLMFVGSSATPITISSSSGGNVTSSGASERVERVNFRGATTTSDCNSSPCTIASQSGSWASSVTRSGTGAYTITVNAGTFNTTPTCTCSAIDNSNTAERACSFSTFASSSGSLTIYTHNSTGTRVDADVNVICMGPR